MAGYSCWNDAMSGSRACTPPSLAPTRTRPFLDVAQVGDGPGGLVGEPQQPRRVVEQQLAGVGQRAVARGPVDEPLAGIVLEPADGLAHGRLGPAQLPGGPREAALGGHHGEDPQVLEGHELGGDSAPEHRQSQ